MAIRTIRGDRLQVVVSYRDADSVVHRVSRMVPPGGGIRKAEELERQIRNELALGHAAIAARNSTVIEVVDRWLELHRPNVRTTTAEEYRRRIDRWIRPHRISRIRLVKLTTQDIDAHLSLLTRNGVGPRSIQLVHAVLSMSFDRAIAWGLLQRNPADVATRPRIPSSEITPPSEDLTGALLATARTLNPLFGLWVHLAVVTGARRGEISGIRWDDIDLIPGTLTIRRTIGPRGHIGDPKTWRSKRVIDLDAHTLTLLGEAWNQAAEAAAEHGDPDPSTRWLFPLDDTGRPCAPYDWPSWQWTRTRRLVSGAEHIRLHDLRHRAATRLLARGISPADVAQRLGNTPAVLLRTYSHAAGVAGLAEAAGELPGA